jgi:hypothetical protein
MGVRYSYNINSISQTATANTTLANSTYLGAFSGGTATQRLNFSEIYLGGEATAASAVMIEVFGRDTTPITTTGLAGGISVLLDGSGTAPATVAIAGNSATTPAARSTSHLLHLSFNAYGGIVRWVARPGEEPSIVGTATIVGGVSLSAFTGSTAATPVSAHVLFEVA